ncbi:hypothetical protein NFI96_029527, partial [Prochilodus magdalenae]
MPVLWKTSCLVPVPKKSSTSSLNDYRPVALTPHVMKMLERPVLSHLRHQVSSFLDPLQFAYHPQIGVDYAVIYLMQRLRSHLDQNNTSVRITFFDFSSAFNTIQPLILGKKMDKMQVDKSMITWVLDYLSGRPQYVRLGSCQSDRLVGPLPPSEISDNSVVVGCIRDGKDGEYRDLVNCFVECSARNHLLLNVTNRLIQLCCCKE